MYVHSLRNKELFYYCLTLLRTIENTHFYLVQNLDEINKINS